MTSDPQVRIKSLFIYGCAVPSRSQVEESELVTWNETSVYQTVNHDTKVGWHSAYGQDMDRRWFGAAYAERGEGFSMLPHSHACDLSLIDEVNQAWRDLSRDQQNLLGSPKGILLTVARNGDTWHS